MYGIRLWWCLKICVLVSVFKSSLTQTTCLRLVLKNSVTTQENGDGGTGGTGGWLSIAEPLILSLITTLLAQSVFQSRSLLSLFPQCFAIEAKILKNKACAWFSYKSRTLDTSVRHAAREIKTAGTTLSSKFAQEKVSCMACLPESNPANTVYRGMDHETYINLYQEAIHPPCPFAGEKRITV